MKYPPKSNILPHFASIMAILSFHPVPCRSPLVLISANFYTSQTEESKSIQIQYFMYHMISDVDKIGSITHFLIESDIDGGRIIANHGSIGNCHIKVSKCIC
jgi:hypothetical protein